MVQTTIRIPKELYDKLKREAQRQGISFNAVMLGALWKLVE